MKETNKTQKIVMAAMLASLTCVATMIIKIPSPMKGYMNLGDCIVLLSGWMMSPVYGFLAAGIGSALADVFSGYVMYAPATFLIKGCMALIGYYGFRFFRNRPIAGLLAEVLMVLGYWIFEGVLYGFAVAAVNIPANAVQGAAGLILGCVLVKVFEKNKIMM